MSNAVEAVSNAVEAASNAVEAASNAVEAGGAPVRTLGALRQEARVAVTAPNRGGHRKARAAADQPAAPNHPTPAKVDPAASDPRDVRTPAHNRVVPTEALGRVVPTEALDRIVPRADYPTTAVKDAIAGRHRRQTREDAAKLAAIGPVGRPAGKVNGRRPSVRTGSEGNLVAKTGRGARPSGRAGRQTSSSPRSTTTSPVRSYHATLGRSCAPRRSRQLTLSRVTSSWRVG